MTATYMLSWHNVVYSPMRWADTVKGCVWLCSNLHYINAIRNLDSQPYYQLPT